MTRVFIVDRANPRWSQVIAGLAEFLTAQSAVHPLRVVVGEPTRSNDQNSLLWAVLTDIAKQVEWPVDGKMQKLMPEDWKHVLTSGLKRETRVAQGIGGGFVMLGQRTSKMTKRQLSEVIEFAYAFGAEHGVRWTEKPMGDESENHFS